MKLIPINAVISTVECGPNQPYVVRVAGTVIGLYPTYRAAEKARRQAVAAMGAK